MYYRNCGNILKEDLDIHQFEDPEIKNNHKPIMITKCSAFKVFHNPVPKATHAKVKESCPSIPKFHLKVQKAKE